MRTTRQLGLSYGNRSEGRITHFVAAAGTGGTITGVGRYLKEKNPNIKVIAGDPTGSILAEYWRSQGANKNRRDSVQSRGDRSR